MLLGRIHINYVYVVSHNIKKLLQKCPGVLIGFWRSAGPFSNNGGKYSVMQIKELPLTGETHRFDPPCFRVDQKQEVHYGFRRHWGRVPEMVENKAGINTVHIR